MDAGTNLSVYALQQHALSRVPENLLAPGTKGLIDISSFLAFRSDQTSRTAEILCAQVSL